MRLVLAAVAVAAAAVPSGAFAVDYLTADQAAKLMFPEADSFEPRSVALDAAQLQQLAAQGVRGRSASWAVRVARRAGATLGFVVSDDVIGKVELISYAVGIALDGSVKQVEILSYRESHGFEIRLPAWRKQFVGKDGTAALRVGEDIANISGATLSCAHVTDGVRRIVAVVALARRSGGLA
ncbi:MAG: FMN-binding protein [Rhizobacter sp.]|nr:FMN-binding protein [Rhizobacter sp.]